MNCGGWEKDIGHCPRKDYLRFPTCSRAAIAGVRCAEGNNSHSFNFYIWHPALIRIFTMQNDLLIFADCVDGDVRLVGGSDVSEGTVEVCFDNLWGLVTQTGWDTNDAQVICRQLGYSPIGETLLPTIYSYLCPQVPFQWMIQPMAAPSKLSTSSMLDVPGMRLTSTSARKLFSP